MKYLVLSMSIGILLVGSPSVVDAQVYGVKDRTASELSVAAKEEMSIVGRLQNLRKATEKLPKGWRVKSEDGKRPLTKNGLLYEVQSLEVMAAERWNQLIRSMALYEGKDASSRDAIRANMQELSKLQGRMNKRLDYFNKRLKTGILMRLAAEVEKKSSAQGPSGQARN